MKVFAISDFHLCISGAKPMEIFGNGWKNYKEEIAKDWKEKVCDSDVVLICGDISWAMKLDEAKLDLNYFEDLPGTKIFIRGNHDYWWQSISNVRNILPRNSFALQNDAVKIGNYVFCGTRGWQAPEKGISQTSEDEKIYKREVIRLDMALSAAKRLYQDGDKIVCMLHYPPFNQQKENNEIISLLTKFDVKYCVFGHIHSYIGKYKIEEELGSIKYFLTSCDLLKNKLIEIK